MLQDLHNVGWPGYKDTWQVQSMASILHCTKRGRDKSKGLFKLTLRDVKICFQQLEAKFPQVLHSVGADFQSSPVHSPPSWVLYLFCARNFLPTLQAFMQGLFSAGFSWHPGDSAPSQRGVPSLSNLETIIFLASKQVVPTLLWLLFPFHLAQYKCRNTEV